MTQKEKSLLLKDLCARLPYGVQCEIGGRRYGPYTFVGNDVEDLISGRMFKPYLRPMSSMTEEERYKYFLLTHRGNDLLGDIIPYDEAIELIDWLNTNHFDFRGLIPKGLAIEVTEENNPYKE